MNEELRSFYRLVQRTRSGVLDWLETLPPDVLVRERDDFAFGSINGIYAHIADCYLWWLGSVARGHERREFDGGSVAALREAFATVDSIVEESLAYFTALDEPVVWTAPEGHQETFTRFWLVLHPITHEFHHKGQALALARVLGHPHHGTPDTDLVTPFPPS
ncbi:MAG TPA: DinB family protein [Trueperaceae bacterium]|nr:DinB family protein [Trueperaceae bacterium]